MYNPFVILNENLLHAMLKQPMYFVREQFARGAENNKTFIPLLFTHYSQNGVAIERAKRHYELLKRDPYRYLYDTTTEAHVQKLKMAARQPDGFRIYVNILPNTWIPPRHLKNHIYLYMLANFPEWKNDQSKKLKINIQDLFGKLYLVFSWKGNKVEVLLDEIEKYR